MKEIFMQMREEDFDGDLEDYLQELDERDGKDAGEYK